MAGGHRSKSTITQTRIADANNVVHTIEGRSTYRREPCPGCPWQISNAGSFPAEAFRISAHTAYDAAMESFGCHESGADKSATCAGFLLRNADNNIGIRLSVRFGRVDMRELVEPAEELWGSYREMAIGNGVDADDPVLAPCRANRR